MDRVRMKREFYRRWLAGEFGNKPRTWKTIDEWERSGFRRLTGIRSLIRGGPCSYYNTPDQLRAKVAAWPCGYSLTEAMPDDRLLIQGEVMNGIGGVHLTYSTQANTTMREAMKKPQTAIGIIAVALLRHYLWPASFEDLRDLLARFPESVIEFGAHDCAVGVLPRRNAVIWEVRNY